jgi:RNA polymerase sigma-70 factor (ECF subfamily)
MCVGTTPEQDILPLLEARRYDEAFEALLGNLKVKVFHLALSILRNPTQAEDAVQDIFVRIWKGLPTYHGGSSLSTWVYTIARNTCLTELKRRARHPTVSLQEPEMAEAASRNPALRSTDPEPGSEMDVESLLGQLPGRSRQVITLFYLEQKSYEETARMIGAPIGTVKTLLFRAKKELARIISRKERTLSSGSKPSQTNSRQSPPRDLAQTLVTYVVPGN